jgi:hypothetical protein
MKLDKKNPHDSGSQKNDSFNAKSLNEQNVVAATADFKLLLSQLRTIQIQKHQELMQSFKKWR